ncbi:MAG TPA: hypothetical protein VGR76_19660, partial [Candidatus Angelobacter sp.]|nr:hypothetical protein [Candidatus Angelobacter sp.]
HTLQAGVSSDNNRMAHQNMQDLITGEVIRRGCLLRWRLLFRSGWLLGAGRNSALCRHERAKTGNYNNDAAENVK